MIFPIIPSLLFILLMVFIFKRSQKRLLIASITITGVASLFILSGVTYKDVYGVYAAVMRGYIADYLMEKTIEGKTFGFAHAINIKRDYYSKPNKSYSYSGAYMLFGKLTKFHGSVDIVCDTPKIYCMKADFFSRISK